MTEHPISGPLRVVFAGTPDFAVPALAAVIDEPTMALVAVYTQPDRPAGRGRRLTASPVKRFALERAVPVVQPASFKDAAELRRFSALRPDLFIVAAYGLILPRAILELPTYATINVHASLLPRWRGAAPIQHAIMAGDRETGISIMRVVEALDAGPVWISERCPIGPHDTAGSIHDRLASLGADCLRTAVRKFIAGEIHERVQDEALVTYATKIDKETRKIDWTRPARELERQVRALSPRPAATAELDGLTVKILEARVLDEGRSIMRPGAIIAASDAGLDIATGADGLRITRLQPAGKLSMGAGEFVNGFRRHLTLTD